MANLTDDQKAFDTITVRTINGIHTSIVVHEFINKYMIIVTQYEKISNVFVACNDIAFTGLVSSQSLNVKHRFGKTSDEIECGINYLLSNLKFNKEIVICMALKEYNRAIITKVQQVLQSLK